MDDKMKLTKDDIIVSIGKPSSDYRYMIKLQWFNEEDVLEEWWLCNNIAFDQIVRNFNLEFNLAKNDIMYAIRKYKLARFLKDSLHGGIKI